ncbi:MAG: type II secretion system protein GspN, partial [Deltaproteobacteria bacterium]|nr:type II secretion system protein GspN [Deltaproteobacteria bacterium]
MKFFKTRFAWAVYILGAALVFLYILFPSELLKEYLANRIHQAHPDLTVEIGRLKLEFPKALRLYDVNVYHSGWAIADLENLKISPNIVSLFLETTYISFQGNGYGGNFKGDMNIITKADDREMVIDADLS